MFTYDPPQLSTKSSSLHGMSPGNCQQFHVPPSQVPPRGLGIKPGAGWQQPHVRRALVKQMEGFFTKHPGTGIFFFVFQPKIVTKGQKIPSDQVMKMDLNLQFFIGYLQWNEAMSQLLAQVRAPVATAATSFSDRLGPWFNGSYPISRKRYDFTPDNAVIMEWIICEW